MGIFQLFIVKTLVGRYLFAALKFPSKLVWNMHRWVLDLEPETAFDAGEDFVVNSLKMVHLKQ